MVGLELYVEHMVVAGACLPATYVLVRGECDVRMSTDEVLL